MVTSSQLLLPFCKVNLYLKMLENRYKEMCEAPVLPTIKIFVPTPYYCCVFIQVSAQGPKLDYCNLQVEDRRANVMCSFNHMPIFPHGR